MQNIITTYLGAAYNDLKTSLAQNNQSNCELSKFSFNNSLPNYALQINCQFYILKYFPAYLAEYKYIYDMLNYYNFNQFIEQYNVVSIARLLAVKEKYSNIALWWKGYYLNK